MARPRKQLDAKVVEGLAARGLSAEAIGDILGVHRATLFRRYATAMKRGRAALQLNVLRRLVEEGVERRNTACLIFLAKTICGLRERYEVDGDLKPVVFTLRTAFRKAESETNDAASGEQDG